MNRRIQVCIGKAKEPVGTLLYETSGNRESCSFAYHPEWLVSLETLCPVTRPAIAGRYDVSPQNQRWVYIL